MHPTLEVRFPAWPFRDATAELACGSLRYTVRVAVPCCMNQDSLILLLNLFFASAVSQADSSGRNNAPCCSSAARFPPTRRLIYFASVAILNSRTLNPTLTPHLAPVVARPKASSASPSVLHGAVLRISVRVIIRPSRRAGLKR